MRANCSLKRNCATEDLPKELVKKKLALLFLFLNIFSLFFNCSLFQKKNKIVPAAFEYKAISNNYFGTGQTQPFPLTVQRGSNLYSSTTADGKYLFFTTDKNGNYDIYMRDLSTSIALPITEHPSAEYKPAISPDGKKLAFVSEEFDSEGDIVLVNIEPGRIVTDHIRGNWDLDLERNYITNPDHKILSKRDRFIDTDPCFSPDGKKIVFSSERLSPGKQNLVLYDLASQKLTKLTEDGASSPQFSLDGKFIVFVSYKGSQRGDIYRLNLANAEIEKLTNDNFIDFSPSLSPDNKLLYYTSIRKDSNRNGELDLRDNSVIVKREIATGKEILLTTGETAIFDTKYSNFNGGSIIFAESIYNAINIYFIPSFGSIPRQPTIQDQFDFAIRLKSEKNKDAFELSLNSIEHYFETDPLFPFFDALVLDQKLDILGNLEKRKEAENLADSYIREIANDKTKYFKKAIAVKWKWKIQKKRYSAELERILLELKTPEEQVWIPAILEEIAAEKEEMREKDRAIAFYQQIIRDYKNYYNYNRILRKQGILSFNRNTISIPPIIFDLFQDSNIRLENKREMLNVMEKSILNGRNFVEYRAHIDRIKIANPDIKNSKQISDLLEYLHAKSLTEEKKFIESNAWVDSYSKPVPPEDPLCWQNPECKPVEICEGDPTCLKSHLLKSKNFEGMGKVNESFSELKVYLENYHPELGVEMDKSEMEKTFRYYENKAMDHQNHNRFEAAAFHYFFNTENMYLLKYKNLYVDSLYKDYAVYYQKRMVDSVLSFSLKQAENERNNLLKKYNLLGSENLDVAGKVSKLFSIFTDNRIAKNLKLLGDVRDIVGDTVLGESALKLIEQHFNLSRPRARPALYLASLYGYSYYLINRGVIMEDYYRQNDSMTKAKKERVLEFFKIAEYELKWILYADPNYSDAYQLLGWLYQYIDITKSIKSEDSEIAEGEIYKDSFDKFFPSKNFEENIDLYQQILAFLGDSSNKKVLSDLNLNLANNYLLLNNFPKARDHFEKVENYSKFVNPQVQFENYKQKSLYHYNYARTLLYLGRYEKAIENLQICTEIYYKSEYYSFRENRKMVGLFKRDIETKYTPAFKLTILHALIGFSFMEIGKYNDSIFHYKKAIALNYEKNYINPLNLYNAMAMAYLKNKNHRLSLHYVRQAKREYEDKYSGWKLFREKISFSDFAWNLVLPENFRVIGDSKFPGAFPPEYQYVFSMGIEIGNYEDLREFQKVEKLFEDRKEFISKKRLTQKNIAKAIDLNDSLNSAYDSYRGSDFEKAYTKYSQVYLESESDNKWVILRRLSFSLFRQIEKDAKEIHLIELGKNRKWLETEKQNYLKTCEPQEITKSELERVRAECLEKFKKAKTGYETLLGLNYYYTGKVKNIYSFTDGYYYLGLAKEILKNPDNVPIDSHFVSGDKFTRMERLYFLLNEACLYLELGEWNDFEKTISRTRYIASEIGAQEILVYANIMESQYRTNISRTTKEYLQIKKNILSTLELIDSNPVNLFTIKLDKIESLYNNLETVLVNLNEWEKISYYRERYQNMILFKNTFSTHFQFENTYLNELYNETYQNIQVLNRIKQLQIESINKRKPYAEILSLEKKELKKFDSSIRSLAKVDSKKKVFFDYKSDYTQFTPKESEIIIQFLQSGENLFAKVHEKNKFLKPIIYQNKLKEDFIQEVFLLHKESINKAESITILLDRNFAPINFANMLFEGEAIGNKKRVQYAFKSNHLNTSPRFNILNLKNISIASSKGIVSIEEEKNFQKQKRSRLQLYDTDLLLGEYQDMKKENVYGESLLDFINLKELFQKDHNIASVVGLKKNYNYDSYWMLTDILIGSGIDTIAFLHPKTKISEIQKIDDINKKFETPENKFFRYEHLLNAKLDYSTEKFEEKFMQALELERIQAYPEAIDKINEAGAFLNKEHKGLRSLRAEFVEARLKAKLYKSENRFYFFETLLNRYKSNTSFYLIALENVLKFCYSYYSEKECEPFYQDYYKLLLFKGISNSERRGSFERVRYFKYLASGKYNRLKKEDISNWAPSIFEDEYLFLYDATNIFKKYFLLDMANEFVEKLLKIAQAKEELKVANNLEREIQILVHLSGLGPKKQIKGSEDIYSSVLSKDWAAFQKFIQNLELEHGQDVIENFRRRLFITWQKLETGEDFNALSIYPEKTALGESIYSVLEDKDKILAFYILSKSTTEQTGGEINTVFDLLLKPETGINSNLAAYMIISYTEGLVGRSDLVSAKKYLEIFEKEFLKTIGNPELENRFWVLKFKEALFAKPENFTEIANNYLSKIDSKYSKYYQKAFDAKPEELTDVLKLVIFENANDKFGSSTKRELLDLIYYLQLLSFSRNNSKVYLNLAFFKDRINSINERFYEKSFKLSELFPVNDYVSEILKTIPNGQSFIAISNFGINTMKVILKDGSFDGNLLKEGDDEIDKEKKYPIDNRVFRKLIFDYYRDVNYSGNAILQKESLETRFRKLVSMEKGKITYLYLSSTWLKIPLEYREDDRFFLVLSPEHLIKNKVRSMEEYFPLQFSILNHRTRLKDPYKPLAALEKLEIPDRQSLGKNTVHITGEIIEFKNLDQILFDDFPLYRLNEKPKREGFWILHRSSLYETSFLKDDLNHAMFLLDSMHVGPGVFSIGLQMGQVSEIYFLKEFLKSSEVEISFRDRYVNAHKKLKFQYPLEHFWIGYRLYTNCYLK